jgi:hypothetical protein
MKVEKKGRGVHTPPSVLQTRQINQLVVSGTAALHVQDGHHFISSLRML